jgi:hypothetical protein
MSTSYVEFRGRGFWSWDSYLEDILRLVGATAVSPEEPACLAAARQHGIKQASGVFAGWICTDSASPLDYMIWGRSS